MERVICSVSTKHCWKGSLHTCPGLASRMETWLREEASGSWGLGCNTGSQEEGLALRLHGQLRPLQGSVGSKLTD